MNYVNFISEKLKNDFYSLNDKEHQELFKRIDQVIDKLKENSESGTKVKRKLWPKEYKKLQITNLWKINISKSWRLIYTIERDETIIVSIILDWFSHKDYERKFKY